jgi:DNA-binding NtrC family response regulator
VTEIPAQDNGEFVQEPMQSTSEAIGQSAAASPEPADQGNVVCFTLRSVRNRAEAQAIRQALGYSGWNRRRAARLLEISYRSLLLKIQQHKITRQTQ